MALADFIQIILIICITSILLTGSFLLYRTVKTQLYNILGLALFFILYGIQFLGEFIFPQIIRALYSQTCLIFLILFIKTTFYRQIKKISFYTILFIFLVLKILDFYFRFYFNFQLPLLIIISAEHIPLYYIFVIITIVEVFTPLTWLGIKSLTISHHLKNYAIEPWIKVRYLLIAISAFFLAASAVLTIFLPISGGYEAVNPILLIFFSISYLIFSFGNLFAWIMPQFLKKYFNRGYGHISDEDVSEKELLENIKKQLERGEES